MNVIKRFCEYENKKELLNTEKPLQIKTIRTLFEIYRLYIPDKFNENLLIDRYDFKKYFKITTIDYSTYDTNYNSYLTTKKGENIPIDKAEIDFKWIRKQEDYLINGNWKPREILSLYSYTIEGYNIVNNYLINKKEECIESINKCYEDTIREGFYFPLFFDLLEIIINKENKDLLNKKSKSLESNEILDRIKYNMKRVNKNPSYMIENYRLLTKIYPNIREEYLLLAVPKLIKTISEFIKRSPPTTKEMVIFRRTKSIAYIDDTNNYVVLKGFSSSSLSLEASKPYGGDHCCLKIIIIPKGSHIMSLMLLSRYKDEYEVLLNRDSRFEFIKKPTNGLLRDNKILESDNYEVNLCDSFTYKYSILELVS